MEADAIVRAHARAARSASNQGGRGGSGIPFASRTLEEGATGDGWKGEGKVRDAEGCQQVGTHRAHPQLTTRPVANTLRGRPPFLKA